MKANELMIGDWVQGDTPVIVDAISNVGICTCLLRFGYTTICLSRLQPIPITPKILEKNGFLYKKLKGIGDNEIWRTEDDYFNIDIYEWSDSIWVFRYDCCEMSLPHTQVTMSYLHELQHALRSCGIDKEIIL